MLLIESLNERLQNILRSTDERRQRSQHAKNEFVDSAGRGQHLK